MLAIEIRDLTGKSYGVKQAQPIAIPGFEQFYFACYQHICDKPDCELLGQWYMAEFTTGLIVSQRASSVEELLIREMERLEQLEAQHGAGYVGREIIKALGILNAAQA